MDGDVVEGAAQTLVLSAPLLRQLVHECRTSLPEECCGLLLGTCYDTRRIVRAIRASPNASSDDRRISYFVPIDWLLATHREARVSDWGIVGAYHSHPQGDARPSARDAAEAWPDFVYLIMAIGKLSATHGRAWCMRKPGTSFEPVEIKAHEAGTPFTPAKSML